MEQSTATTYSYIQAQIAQLTQQYNQDVASIRANYAAQLQQLRHLSAMNRRIQSNVLSLSMKNDIRKRTNKWKADIQTIQRASTVGQKRALLIGINYIGTQYELQGCINDVTNVSDYLTSHGFTQENITVLTDESDKKPTRNMILSELTHLLEQSKAGDFIFLMYSGHGSYKQDLNGDEPDGYDELIVPLSGGYIVDDELKQLVQRLLKKDVTMFAMFDSCFSGSILDLRYQYMDSLHMDKFTENKRQLVTKGTICMISGCNDEQTSADAVIQKRPTGAMTWALMSVLRDSSPPKTWRELLTAVRTTLKDSHFEQIPQFSSGTSIQFDSVPFIYKGMM